MRRGDYEPDPYEENEHTEELLAQEPTRLTHVEEPKRGSPAPWLLLFLVLAAAGVLGYVLWQELQAQKAARAQAQAAAGEATEKVAASEASKSDMQAKLASAETEANLLRARVDELSAAVKEKDSELDKLKSTYNSLEEKLNDEIKKGEVRLSEAGGRIQVDLVDKILFDSGKADLSDRGKEVLSRVGAILAGIQDKQIQVSGHTDDSPITDKLKETFPSNWELSAARAVNVVRYLAEQAKVPGKRLVAAGYGQFHPVADNVDANGRARNRRIEILLTPALDAKPGALPAAEPLRPALANTEEKPAEQPKAEAKAETKAEAKPTKAPAKTTKPAGKKKRGH